MRKTIGAILAFALMTTTCTFAGCNETAATSYTVSYDCRGGRAKVSDTYVAGELFSPTPPSATVALTGYTFTGWYYDEECTRPYDYLNPQIDSDITLYAGWSNLHYINFYTESGERIQSVRAEYGANVSVNDLPVPAALTLADRTYPFDYWKNINNGERVSDDFTMPSMDLNLYAVYKTGLSAAFSVAKNGDWVATSANAMTCVEGQSLSGYGCVETDMTIMSGAGWAGIAFQISEGALNYDEPFSQSDVFNYQFVILSGGNPGATQIVKRDAGSYNSCSTGWALTGTALKNTNYAKKYEEYKTSGDGMTFRLKVEITEDRVNGYIWDDITGAYELVCFATTDGKNSSGTPNTTPVKYELTANTGVGLISQTSGVRFSNFKVTPAESGR
ncbi:MAG: InlB B-repeat-containing protein [Candidatus Scatosoma sp.]